MCVSSRLFNKYRVGVVVGEGHSTRVSSRSGSCCIVLKHFEHRPNRQGPASYHKGEPASASQTNSVLCVSHLDFQFPILACIAPSMCKLHSPLPLTSPCAPIPFWWCTSWSPCLLLSGFQAVHIHCYKTFRTVLNVVAAAAAAISFSLFFLALIISSFVLFRTRVVPPCPDSISRVGVTSPRGFTLAIYVGNIHAHKHVQTRRLAETALASCEAMQ